MDSSCQFFKFGYCKLKDDCEKNHVKEECRDGLQCKAIKTCSLRHPKMCKRVVLEGLCRYGEGCAYNHKRSLHGLRINDDAIQEDINKLKTEVEVLKNTIKLLVSIREEGNILEKSVKDIEGEIKLLKAENKELLKRIQHVEDDLKDETDEKSHIIESKQTCKDNVKKTSGKFKCYKCEFYGNTEVQLKKHVNTKHENEYVEAMIHEKGDSMKTDCFEGIEGIETCSKLK